MEKLFRAHRRTALCAMRSAITAAWTDLLTLHKKSDYTGLAPEQAAERLLLEDDDGCIASSDVLNLAEVARGALLRKKKKNGHSDEPDDLDLSSQTLLFVLDVVRSRYFVRRAA